MKATLHLFASTTVIADGPPGEIQQLISITLGHSSLEKLEGAPDELSQLLHGASGKTRAARGRSRATGTSSTPLVRRDKQSPSDENQSDRPAKIIKAIQTGPDSAAIVETILDQGDEVNRTLLPLYVISRDFGNAFGLTTGQIEKITQALGVRVKRQNALRAINNARQYVVSLSTKPPTYTLRRSGFQYLNKIIRKESIAPDQ